MPDTSIPSPTRKESEKFSSVYEGEDEEEEEEGAGGVSFPSTGPAAGAAVVKVSEGIAVLSSGSEVLGESRFFFDRRGFFLTAVMVSVLVPPSSEICASTSSFLQPGRSAVRMAASSVSTTSWGGVPAVGVESEKSRRATARWIREKSINGTVSTRGDG